MQVGRNEACPCGSRKKFKNCCEGKSARGLSKGLIALFVVLAAIAAIAFVPRDDDSGTTTSLPAPASRPALKPGPRPAGPVPPGKVWSVEHGHWHDIAAPNPASQLKIEQTSGSPLTPTVGTVPQPKPQPDGPVPPGKVWSPEHGHWHDAAPPAAK